MLKHKSKSYYNNRSSHIFNHSSKQTVIQRRNFITSDWKSKIWYSKTKVEFSIVTFRCYLSYFDVTLVPFKLQNYNHNYTFMVCNYVCKVNYVGELMKLIVKLQ